MAKIDANLVSGGIGLIGWFPDLPPVLDQVSADMPAARAGLQAGDLITAINNEAVASWQEVVKLISANPGKQVVINVKRGASQKTFSLIPDVVTDNGAEIGRIGIMVKPVEFPADRLVTVSYGAVESSVLTLRMLAKMITLEVSSKNISGPITIAQYAGKSAQVGFTSFILFLAIVSVSLGVLNLLPIPILDGGHLLYYSIEAITGRPVSEKVMIWGQQVGILLLFLLMSLAVYNDLGRLLN